MIFTCGAIRFAAAAIPRISAVSPIGTKIALVWEAAPGFRTISSRDRQEDPVGCVVQKMHARLHGVLRGQCERRCRSLPALSTIDAPSAAIRPRFTGLQFAGKKIFALIPNCFAA